MNNPLTFVGNDPVLTTLILILFVWELAWKGGALWSSARSGHKNWFILLLILNTAGILPIVYLLMRRGKNSGLKY